jgi:hypothetical protein
MIDSKLTAEDKEHAEAYSNIKEALVVAKLAGKLLSNYSFVEFVCLFMSLYLKSVSSY